MKFEDDYCSEGCGRILELHEKKVCDFCYEPKVNDYSLGYSRDQLKDGVRELNELEKIFHSRRKKQ